MSICHGPRGQPSQLITSRLSTAGHGGKAGECSDARITTEARRINMTARCLNLV